VIIIDLDAERQEQLPAFRRSQQLGDRSDRGDAAFNENVARLLLQIRIADSW